MEIPIFFSMASDQQVELFDAKPPKKRKLPPAVQQKTIEEEAVALTEEQQKIILDKWNSAPKGGPYPTVAEIVDAAYPGKGHDVRGRYGLLVKSFLATRHIVAPGGAPGISIELTEEQKEYIRNNCHTMGGLEMATVLFNKPGLSKLHHESRAVFNYLRELKTESQLKTYDNPDNLPPEKTYTPPKSISQALRRINVYQHTDFKEEALNGSQRKNAIALIAYLHTYRFIHQCNRFQTIKERDLFESSFINYVFDKPDLTAEEVDLFITVSHDVVIADTIQGHIATLQRLLDSSTEEEDPKVSMGLVEAISSARKEYNDCVNRKEKFLNNLVGKRSERMDSQVRQTASILNLVQLWKMEDSRKKLIAVGDQNRERLQDAIEELKTMEDIKARIMGIGPEELLNG